MKSLNQQLEKWIKEYYAFNDMTIRIFDHCTRFELKKEALKYNDIYYNKLSDMINGARYFTLFMQENKKKSKNKR